MAWLMGIGSGLWVARYRNRVSKPLKLPKAKQYAVEMVKGIRPGREVIEPIRELNLLEAKRVVGSEWPTELMGGRQETDNKNIAVYGSNLKQAILDTELGFEASPEVSSPRGDDCQLEYYADGYPNVPACLRRNVAEGPAGGRASRLSNRKILSGNRTLGKSYRVIGLSDEGY